LTLSRFVVRNILRNKRRSLLTVVSLAFSFLLLIFIMSIWRSFYVEQWTANGAAPDLPPPGFAVSPTAKHNWQY
jgi:predicted lysophospholipase L1 biosynthesis ABC-type transport system permease subunit